jgi:glycosyltransferase involved in cell wall biosynthesis
VTVVIPVYGARSSLVAAIDAVLAQAFTGTFDLVVVATADSPGEVAAIPERSGLTVVTRGHRLRPAAARNLALTVARGRYVVFTDDDVVPDPDWLATLVATAEEVGTGSAVTGSIVNGTPASLVGTAEYIVDRLDVSPSRPRGVGPWHGDTANLLVPRELWERFGPFDEGSVGATDTEFTSMLFGAGLLFFEPAARITHLNRTRLVPMLRVQYYRGRTAAHLGRTEVPHPAKQLLAHPALAPLALLARLASVYRRTFRWARADLVRTVLLLPVLVVALGAWAAGLAVEGTRLDRAARREAASS